MKEIKNYRVKIKGREIMVDEDALISGIKSGHYKGNEEVKLLGGTDDWRKIKDDPELSDHLRDKSQRVVRGRVSAQFLDEEEELINRMTPEAKTTFKPLRLGQILDRTFHLFKSRFWKNLKMVFYVQIFVYLINQLIKFGAISFLGTTGYDYNSLNLLTLLPTTIISSIAFLLIASAVVKSTRAQMFGVDMGVGEAYRSGRSSMLPLFWTGFLATLFVSIGMVLFIIPGVILIFSYILFQVVVILEKKSGLFALERSNKLMRVKFEKGIAGRNTWRAFVLLLVSQLFTGTIYMIFYMPRLIYTMFSGMAGYYMAENTADLYRMQTHMAIFELIESVGMSAIIPFILIGLTVLYYDTRIRTEGLDLYIGSKNFN